MALRFGRLTAMEITRSFMKFRGSILDLRMLSSFMATRRAFVPNEQFDTE